jgi:hypothetical protein
MKKPGFAIFRSLVKSLVGRSFTRRAAPDQDDTTWKLLLSSFNARISVASKPHTNNTHRVFFRHSFPGFARIELVVCSLNPDGSAHKNTTLHASGYAFNALSDSRNVLLGGPGARIRVLSLSVHYIAHGVNYHLQIDAEPGTYHFLKDGKPYAHGPQYTLALQSLTLTAFSPAPVFTPHRPGMLPLSLAAC